MNPRFVSFAFLIASAAFAEADLSFSSMGTVWTLTLGDNPKSIQIQALQEALVGEALLVDRTFSDWSSDSELRLLEKKNLTRLQKPSELFMNGLKLARDAFRLSEGTFDITVGAVIWKVLPSPVGLDRLVIKGKSFRFTRDPKRLSFGGIIKGAAVGSLAAKIYESGIHHFMLNAGGGNLVSVGNDHGHAWSVVGENPPQGEVLFVSRSNSSQDGRQHIIDPHHPTEKFARQSEVICVGSKDPRNWFHESGLADAFSTALLVNPNLASLPAGCQSKAKQESR